MQDMPTPKPEMQRWWAARLGAVIVVAAAVALLLCFGLR